MLAPSPLTIGAIHAETRQNQSFVWTEIDGEKLWFSSTDAVLQPSPEAFATALLMPALVNNRRLLVQNAVCSRWASQIPTAVELLHQWWNVPRIPPRFRTCDDAATAGEGRIGLCFSGGVDSFFSLLRHRPRVETLIYVYDYDIPIRGHSRQPHFEPWFRRLADKCHVQPIVIRTNLKTHPLRGEVDWFAAHGACLAATGHLLSDRIGTLVMSSSYDFSSPHPSGTHWKLDPLWSSARLDCTHFGATHKRTKKLLEIAQEPLLREFLRVCWANEDDRQNCGSCEKCLRTQLILVTCGELANFRVFYHDTPLAERIDQVQRIHIPDLIPTYEAFLEEGLPLSVEQAVARLVNRSWKWHRRVHAKHEWRGRVNRILGRQPDRPYHPLST